ncbi:MULTISPECIES: MFS transporter [Agrobacterium]|uniref:Carbohydrate transporter (Modular protein) n=1 Tax=Agrobacterium deltaense NCPPB 1641 TaxID=1183425 RepID=A0A1S7TJ80_9HYPH|nr:MULTISPECIES: MFS transporter [Agrobacterium]QNP82378.1 MFS transporter [Agrobacterium tumefaciens]WFS65136.1 MFS transporter [Agrobacterium leguminum]CVI54306.1 Carbohydrate transporter (modular protein) [Agrobacterium deltaense NCPPB 1641]
MDMPVSRSISAGHADSKPLASWAAVASIGIGAFALVTTEFLPVGLLPLIAADLGISEGTAGLMVTVPGFLAALAAPMTLGFAARFDRKRVLVALLMLLVVSNAIVATAHGFAALMFGRVLLGIAVGGFWTIGGSLGPRLRPGAEGPRATALIFSGVSLGTVAGVPAGALIGDLFGWRTAFLLVSGVALLVVAALQFLLPSIRAQKGSGLKQVPDVLRLQRVQIGLTAAVLIFVGQFAAYTYITPFLIGATGIDTGTLSMVLLGYGAAGFAGNLFGGWAAGRNFVFALAGTAFLIALSVAGLLLAGSNTLAAVAWVVTWGFGFGMLPIAMQTFLFTSAPDRLESIAALFVSIAQLAIGLGALVGGLAVDNFGVPSALWLGAASALLTAGLIASTSKIR